VTVTVFLISLHQPQTQLSFLYNLLPSYMGMKIKNRDKPTRRRKRDFHHPRQVSLLQATLCVDRCASDCVVYQTPWMTCYNGQILFPGDPSWSEWDILDIPLQSSSSLAIVPLASDGDGSSSPLSSDRMVRPLSSFQRFFFGTQNATCASAEPTDTFTLPLNACLGPFGAPRPWGNFTTTGSTTVVA
jgi:hypothetical protein